MIPNRSCEAADLFWKTLLIIISSNFMKTVFSAYAFHSFLGETSSKN